MSRHDDTPPMKRVLPLPPAKRVIPTNHPAYRNYEARLLAKAEKDITTQQPSRPACKTTMADVLALILAMFILMVLAACALLVILWGLS
ncbi:hypothetical protein CFAL_11885 (plasmid) [Corynebacterium falsenii DSM 44353]|uniref:hypothetical protein n=1 Tax=Corynebacterium falsenii TaxID=108486 RepID=UPI0003E941D1|nr:hypothetical protein [Corynebacterium falsenii]AHI04395.1 hypothetical protein CFAL_09840 [Corynebacterium falsenii DSM 44353]AHI04454.1 hypothetical protein CFAL_11885 [Corynebacterium falsenii DSM 44353]UBI04612.1 hypothetical protein LA343_11675 [Corynebacterium falsenii]